MKKQKPEPVQPDFKKLEKKLAEQSALLERKNRELQIEAALEKIRQRTMAMQSSDELADAATVLFKQLRKLGGNLWSTGFVLIDDQKREDECWMSDPEGEIWPPILIPNTKDIAHKNMYNHWKKGNEYYVLEEDGEELNKHYKYLMSLPKAGHVFHDLHKAGVALPSWQEYHAAYFTYGYLLIITLERSNEADLFKRFAKVFDQTYTRFLDLKKAESQAREAQIEVGLERVRARALAMHSSEELGEAATVLYKELILLGITDFVMCGYVLVDEKKKIQHCWMANTEGDFEEPFILPLTGDMVLQKRFKAWKRKDLVFYQEVGGEKLKNHIQFVIPFFGSKIAENIALNQFPDPIIFYCSNFSEGYLHILASKFLTKEEEMVLARFTSVFELSYRRFLDLKKAEEQAREAQIEVALERVRTSSMAMHQSTELPQVALELLSQMELLGISDMNCSINIVNPETKNFISYSATSIEKSNKKDIYQFPELNLNDFGFLREAMKKVDAGLSNFTLELVGELLKELFETWKKTKFSGLKNIHIIENPDVIYLSCAQFQNHKYSSISVSSIDPLTKEQMSILQRMAQTFSMSYTRFLDLNKAESQAREAQIEAGLEKVRSRSLAMHKSDELGEAAILLHKELRGLGITKVFSGGYVVIDEVEKIQHGWMTDFEGGALEGFKLPLVGDHIMKQRYESWKRKDPVFFQEVGGQKLSKHMDFVSPYLGSREVEKFSTTKFPDPTFFHFAHFSHGYLQLITNTRLSAIEESLMVRFTKVFEMTYNRFLDLKKAEAQAREAQIEAALERVRSKTMAMHRSDELLEVIITVFDQLEKLDIETDGAHIHIYDGTKDFNLWIANPEQNYVNLIHIPYFDRPIFNNFWESLEREEEFITENYTKEEKNILLRLFFKHSDLKNAPEKRKQFLLKSAGWARSIVFGKNAALTINNFEGIPFSSNENEILKRLGKVFEQTYTRFLDLVKAEEQAREAQIEAALERVRARALAMHTSEELYDVANVLREQMGLLGQSELEASVIHIYEEGQKTFESWFAVRPPDKSNGKILNGLIHFGYEDTEIAKDLLKLYKGEAKEYTVKYSGVNMTEWVKEIGKKAPEIIKYWGNNPPEYQIFHFSDFSGGSLIMISYEDPSKESMDLQKRAALVFDLAYRRFLDLKNAEAQAREAQIEAALERIRGRAMALRNSHELHEVIVVIYEELSKMDMDLYDCNIIIIIKKTKEMVAWGSELGDVKLPSEIKIPYHDHPVVNDIYSNFEKGVEYRDIELSGEVYESYKKFLVTETDYKNAPEEYKAAMLAPKRIVFSQAFMNHGLLEAAGTKPLPEDKADILKRFAKVVDLTYTRYDDLVQAEARTWEAVRQASLDRVRGVIASMRSKEDLTRITPLIWKELTTLNVPFIRCGVFIMDVENEIIESYLSTPDGKTLGVFSLPFTSELIGELMVDYWEKGKIYKEHWSKEQFVNFMKRLNKTGQLKDPNSYQGAAPPDSLDLHFIPFKQGMLYVGNMNPLTKDELQLVRSLAEAFSIAYARYEDFRELEIAKNQIEATLNELKSTQSQLIHAEKMASLGELTAGIAHEIQNPLNFVNNFSEVSVDLIEELKSERSKIKGERDQSLEEEILADVIQNLEKINHHGQRASSIVKGMLEHSGTGSKEKQLIDINALTDEYLRLAYHGLRAKDKSFNADFKTEFDEKLPKLKVIPQDIGRVLLNLINNAFYATNKKSKHPSPNASNVKVTEDSNYKPQVSVSTKKVGDKVEIRVKDNGEGIPEKIRDKIFQPFFTTKPTGQGTGLGLSLSYDIVTKGHGGDLKVESNNENGTTFLIIIPV